MKFYEEVKKLQEKNKEKIVMIKNGIFFIAVGEDALILEKIFHLKPVCFKENVCKCVIPVKRVEKYVKAVEERELSLVLYNYDKNGGNKIEENIYNESISIKDICSFLNSR